MKSRGRRRKRAPVNVTAHWRAIADPEIAAAIKQLRVSWKKLNRVDRGDRLQELARHGCSTSGLAAALKISATTVRRHMELAALPEEDRTAVAKGASAKKVLTATAEKRRLRRLKERLVREQETGQFSDELADAIIAFCKADVGSEVAFSRDELPPFLRRVAQRVQSFEAASAPRQRMSKRISLAKKFSVTEPEKLDNDFWFEQHAEWLARFVWDTAPERQIWENGLVKAQQRKRELARVLARSRVLDGSRTPVGRDFTFVVVPSRRVTRPAREVLKRKDANEGKR